MNATNRNEAYSFHPGGCNFCFCDGSVSFVRDSISITLFAAMITRAYGPGEDLVTPGGW